MTRKLRLLFPFVFLCLPGLLYSQAWSGILGPSRAIDWSHAGVTGGIPNRTTICSTLNPGATAAQIQSALNSCPGGEVVYLNAGSYSLSTGLTIPASVTLRGAGANQTLLTFTGSGSYYWGSFAIGFIGNYDSSADNGSPPGPAGSVGCTGSATYPNTYTGCAQLRSWTGTNGSSGVYTKGATVLNLASAPTGLNVGDTLQLVQAEDQSVANGPLICDSTSAGCSREGAGFNYYDTALRQNVKVTAVSGSQVTVTPGIYADWWSTSRNPVAYWFNASNPGRPETMAGLENVGITSNVVVWAGIVFYEASDCWVHGVALHVPSATSQGAGNGSRYGFLIHLSRNITIENSWLDTLNGGGYSATTSYGISNLASSADLIQNNILYNVESPIITGGSGAGDVYAYNYDPGVCTPTTGCTGIVTGHDVGTVFDLFEGNVGPEIRPDTYHGTEPFWTLFRNRLTATETQVPTENAIDLWSYARYYNIIGNVLGTAGISNNYQCYNSASTSNPNCSRYGTNIYRIGYGGDVATTGTDTGVSPDSQTYTTLMRWGNYDVVNGSVQWNSSEVPSGLSQYASAVPSTHNLPPSFYSSSKPIWWPASKPWPAIGPDVTGGNMSGTAGYAYTIPAQDCYNAARSMANFNADTCYPQSVSPAPPTNLTAAPH